MAVNSFADALLLEALPAIEKTRYAELSSTVIILFDHIITLDQEINLIWHSHWSLGKILFLLNRYYALCIVIFNNYALFNNNNLTDSHSTHRSPPFSCLSWFRWQGWTGVITFVIAELILQLRLYALYFRDRRILACMVSVCLGAAASSAYVMGSGLSHITSVAVTLPHTRSTVCVPSGLPGNFYAFWIPMLISESVLCGLALFRGFQSYRPGSNVFQSGRRIIEILVRDSLSYFVIIFATYLVNAILFLTRPDSEVEIPIGFAVALSVVMSNRLCLNVRGYIRAEHASLLTSLPPRPPGAGAYPHAGSGIGIGSGSGGYPGTALVSLDGYGGSRAGYEGDYDEDYDEEGYYESAEERSWGGRGSAGERRGPGAGEGTVSIVSGGALSELEMRELRAMRAKSPKHLRTL
ncbi:hypothetical protein C8Q73DRAFT_789102 [Cubamyces lactineus]|nr:hypothetical protein C8Q73DRAFT_789102 [Cubamyces lactineus]